MGTCSWPQCHQSCSSQAWPGDAGTPRPHPRATPPLAPPPRPSWHPSPQGGGEAVLRADAGCRCEPAPGASCAPPSCQLWSPPWTPCLRLGCPTLHEPFLPSQTWGLTDQLVLRQGHPLTGPSSNPISSSLSSPPPLPHLPAPAWASPALAQRVLLLHRGRLPV